MGSPKSPYATIILASTSILILLVVALIASSTSVASRGDGESLHKPLKVNVHAQTSVSSSSPPPAIALICNNTIYPQACIRGFSSYIPPHSLNNASPQQLVSIALKAALVIVRESHSFAKNCSKYSGEQGLHVLERQAIEDCIELMESARDQLNLAISNLSSIDTNNLSAKRDALLNLNVWLSASLSFQTACSDGFQFVSYGKCEKPLLKRQEQVSEVLINSLYLVKKLSKHGDKLSAGKKIPPAAHRGLLATSDDTVISTLLNTNNDNLNNVNDGFPGWLSSKDRKLLQAPIPSIYADMIVAQDGTGDYLNVTDALNNVPTDLQGQRFIVYIKEGVYDETFNVPKNLANLTFLGDGIGYTVITGSNNVGSGLYNTLRTSTVGISGEGFLARDMTFRNTAGPEGYQAVALRASADFLVFYRCSFEGYQDTLYALSSRQFYRDCKIYGTVDFIFGNAIASFQSCDLLARRPLQGQQNTITAQGRKVDVDISGFSFQNCSLLAAQDLASAPFTVFSYLGRPWKAYSRTVFMQSFFDSLIHPAGWLAWNASNPFTDTVYYGEYENRGPGSATDNRVSWKGVHPVMNSSDAMQFTADNFIIGSSWLPLNEVEYTSGLSGTPQH